MESPRRSVGRPLLTPEQKNVLAQIGSNIRAAREAAGMTQQQVAEALGADDYKYVLRCEQGKFAFSALRLVEFARVLGVDPASLLDGIH